MAGSILIISGTNRPGANALRVSQVLEQLYRAGNVAVDLLSLAELPREVFEGAAYATKPEGMVKIQQRVLAAAGLHMVTPEYNGGFPGVLKYFIDMLPFPESFQSKPVAFVGEAQGMFGAMRPVEQLTQIFLYRNAHVFHERVLIPNIDSQWDKDGQLNAELLKRLQKQAAGFPRFVAQVTGQG
jgi:chromate reductase, NAD(P)H dehydrogenase (quinone)